MFFVEVYILSDIQKIEVNKLEGHTALREKL
jgi:hypothetical protein